MDTGAPVAKSLADEVTDLSDTISVCERLCLLSARTLLRSAISLDNKTEGPAPLAFIPSISRDLQNPLPISAADNATANNPHPTTTAHCVTALQTLLPVIGRFQLGTHESKSLAFHPIEREMASAFAPKAMSNEIRSTINAALRSLSPPEPTGAAPQPGPAKAAGSAEATQQSNVTSAASGGRDRSTFRPMHPFRAAQVLRALAPSQDAFQPVVWTSLFTVAWFLNRRSGSLRGFPSIQATDSPGTAFLTSKCVEAIEIVLSVFERRRKRFKQLFELMNELRRIVTAQEELKKIEDAKLISEPLFHHGYRLKTAVLIPEIRACVGELAWDSALPATYHAWNSHLTSRAGVHPPPKLPDDQTTDLPHDKYKERYKSAENFLLNVVESFRAAMSDEPVPGQQSREKRVLHEQEKTRAAIERSVGTCENMLTIVRDVLTAIRAGREARKAKQQARPHSITDGHLRKLPAWICSRDYWIATKRMLNLEPDPGSDATQSGDSEPLSDTLELHWARHQEAAENALKTLTAFRDYVLKVLRDFDFLRDAIPVNPDLKSVATFVDTAGEATGYMAALRRQLSNDLDVGVRWAEVVMNRHLAYAASGAMVLFDPSELAHAVRVMCRDTGRVRFALILKALQVVAAAQHSDGTWSCQQPFYWRDAGFALWTMSMETAMALVSTVQMLVANPERYGTGPTEVTDKLRPIYDALDRFLRWLSGGLVSLRPPPALIRATAPASARKNQSEPPPLYGWCSERLPESERIHSWATAIAIELLVEFRRLMQERINALLRTEFLSHSPSELMKLWEVEPTDLGNVGRRDEEGPVIARLMKLLREHKHFELIEGSWIPSDPKDKKISSWSVLLYGPPGTSKTFLAKAIAGELGWPLISISPSDFLAKGDTYIEARAQEIFTAFSAGSRLVFLFDEIDELIRDRKGGTEHRSVLSFLTPSFLTKLQDFRGAAERKEFIFILATNYKDRIDSAAIRSGRIDQLLPVVYPDSRSRAFIAIRHLVQRMGNKEVGEQFVAVGNYLKEIQECLAQTSELEGPAERFLDNLAEFSGFLSHQKFSTLLKLLPNADFSDHSSRQMELRELIKELSAIGRKEAGRFQPEISLSEYAERPAVFDDELKFLVKVIPNIKFPWRLPEIRREKAPTQPLLAAQVEELYERINDERFSEFKRKVGDLLGDLRRKPRRPRRKRQADAKARRGKS
jgi:ATPase family associated with various cellular activities (AAA)